MRILQVLPLIATDGAFGGPAVVATNQATELAAQGADVTLAAGTMGSHSQLATDDALGHIMRNFRTVLVAGKNRYFSAISPNLLIWLIRNARKYDVVHVHLSRDFLSTPAAIIVAILGVPLVVQPHGTLHHNTRLPLRVFDRLFTRPLLKRAHSVLFLTEREREELKMRFDRELRPGALTHLSNGIPLSPLSARTRDNQNVLFLARIQARKRPDLFVEAAARANMTCHSLRFSIAGPDGGSLSAIRDMIDRLPDPSLIKYEGAVPPSAVDERMAASLAYVLTAADEPFGLTVIEALAQETPVIVGESAGLASFISTNRCGLVVQETAQGFAEAITVLARDPLAAHEYGIRGREAVAREYSIQAVVSTLLNVYEAAGMPAQT